MRRIALVVAVLHSLAPVLALGDSDLHPVDRWLFIRYFGVSIRSTPDGDPHYFLSMASAAPTESNTPVQRRGFLLADVYRDLKREDPSYLALNERTAIEIAAATRGLPYPEGRRVAWPILLASGLIEPIVERAEPSPVAELPDDLLSPFGDQYEAWQRGNFSRQLGWPYTGPIEIEPYLHVDAATVLAAADASAYPAAARVVYGCGGTIVSAPCETSPEAAAHCRLKADDPEYAEQVRTVLQPHADRLPGLDPLDLDARAAWTDALWGAMVSSGLARRIEAAVEGSD